jgi:hypothetical protein
MVHIRKKVQILKKVLKFENVWIFKKFKVENGSYI